MGEMADWFIEQALDSGSWYGGLTKRRRRSLGIPATPKKPTCGNCGCVKVHWRLFDGSYRLADDAKQHPGNRYVEHRCPTSADGFEDVPDA